jgi:hypothetical protein
VRDKTGEVSTVRYEAVNAILLNEFLKEHRKGRVAGGDDCAATKDVQVNVTRQQRQIEALTAGPTESERTARRSKFVPCRT